ncbi:DNA-binding HxlR family transcriptional regulator [Lactobacillus colini]|uniref:DNA-binding HxlR family transcriptional regulator n=1 Tax=Lactobacillus colini TaxID=1819254 RepID=A0ABS4MC70_9LACO|nr:helix-turn-helix domain-containing protein [Lactobacillus colini]MBP2057208.1 DNA-binding HxlR family transcriptional regulator [Lactobacillus colini]
MKKQVYHLGIDITLEILNGKWKPSIICHLGTKQMRHDELMHLIPGISQKVLTQQLNSLIEEEIVEKEDNHNFPRVVTYALTETGRSLRKVLIEMSLWGEKRAKELSNEGIPTKVEYTEPTGYQNL